MLLRKIILEDSRKIFKKVPGYYFKAYDYKSIMHYRKNASATNSDLITLETKNKNFQVNFIIDRMQKIRIFFKLQQMYS